MAKTKLIVYFLLANFLAWRETFAEEGDNYVECEDVCQQTYPPHTYPNGNELSSCRRGCRLFSIIDLLEPSDVNYTRNSCIYTCGSAYAESENLEACNLGCKNKEPFFPQLNEFDMDFFRPSLFDTSFMSPLLYVRDFYSNMVSKVGSGPSYYSNSWSFYMDNTGNGKVVIIQSGPQYSSRDYMTANYVESNLESVDNSATPNLKNSQIPTLEMWKQLEGGEKGIMYPRDLEYEGEESASDSSGWINCFSRHPSKSHMLMLGALLISTFGLILLCLCNVCSTPADHRRDISTQKLSIHGDCDYLDQKKYLMVSSPQQPLIEAPPLPLKLKVGDV